MRVVLTRPDAQSHELADLLVQALGDQVEPIVAPMMEIVLHPIEVDFAAFDILVFTSQNGVRAYGAAGGPIGRQAYCVGRRTAEKAREIGLEAVSAEGNIDALNAILERDVPQARLLHLSGAHIAGTLRGDVTRVVAYSQQQLPVPNLLKSVLDQSVALIIPLFSPNSATLFGAAIGAECKARMTAICMSGAVAENLDSTRFETVLTCPEPTRAAMFSQIIKTIEAQSA